MRFRRKSVSLTVGDRALEDLHVRAATQRGRAIAAESRDWLLVKSVMQPGERARARVAVRFPHEGNAAGFAFVTDQRVIFEVRERVTAVALAYVVFAGRPIEPSLGDFVVTARTAGGPSGGEFTTAMRIRDAEAFHDFFPTLLDAARAAGALPEVDTSWGGDVPQASVPRRAETAEPLPTDVLDRALATFMEDDERIAFAAEMVCDAGGRVTVLVTQRRLVVIESRLIWAAPLERTRVAEASGRALQVCLLAETVTDSLVLGGGLASVDPGQRRLTLRSDDDPAVGVRLHTHLRAGGAGPLMAWPAAE
ncbi:hypothetical protein ABN028_11575 [Actinopolymorpha sp. B17G11]|uniref:hypothetical protein n=1 Tax=Actinopolymorpha sp. B17G11 TaxID=3160861 RepID=UPI0032E524FF